MKNKPQMITYQELSDLIQVPIGTLYCMVHKKEIPHLRLGERTVRFLRKDIDKWIKDSYVMADTA